MFKMLELIYLKEQLQKKKIGKIIFDVLSLLIIMLQTAFYILTYTIINAVISTFMIIGVLFAIREWIIVRPYNIIVEKINALQE